jgi:uroporphyrinogen decarboxylase
MTPRERVQKALRHEEPDRVPHYLGFTLPARRKFEEFCGTQDIEDRAENALAVYSTRRNAPWVEVSPGIARDAFGVLWNRSMDPDIGVVERYPLPRRDLAGYEFPDPRHPVRFAALPEFIERNRHRFRLVNHGFTLFERAWSLRSMPDVLLDMVDDPAWTDLLLDRIVEFNLGLIAELVRHDIDGIMFGDDWASQRGLIMGPRLWRRFLKPRLTEMSRAVKAGGKAVFVHSCGKVEELFEDLIEIGVDAFNPFQPEVMDPAEMKRAFGDRIAFFGGVSIQRTLPRGSPEDVREEARRLKRTVGRGGGYILAPSHDMPGDIPAENIAALVEAALEA